MENKKKQLVILTHICYPIPSATGKIALQYAKYLKDKYEIRIISLQDRDYELNGEVIDGLTLYTISQWRLRWAQKAEERIKRSGSIICLFWKSIYFVLRALGRVQSLFFTMDNIWWYKRKALIFLNELNNKKRIDTILSINTPIEAHICAFEFRKHHPKIRWVCYWGDLFASQNFKMNVFQSIGNMKKLEKKLIGASDLSLTTEEIFYILCESTKNEKKLRSIPYGINDEILQREEYADSQKEDRNIVFVCIGSFYRKFRNPEKMLDAFASPENHNYKLDLYTAGECQDIVDKYVKVSKGRIQHHGLIPYDKLMEKMYNADCLINIENNVEYCNPSKLLEMISFKKPIVDFAYGKQTNTVLDKYPLALQLDSRENGSVLYKRIENFIIHSSGKSVSEKKVRELFPENLESSIKELIRESV